MDRIPVFALLALVSWVSFVDGDDFVRIATWKQPRAAVVRDTVYLDGGEMNSFLWDSSALNWTAPGSAILQTPSLQTSGYIYALSLNKTFSVDDDFLKLFSNWTLGPVQLDEPFRSGFMFADDYEFYTFG